LSRKDEDEGVRWVAAEGLIELDRAGLEPLLRALIWRSNSPWLRHGAHHVLSTLARRKGGSWLDPVLAALHSYTPGASVPLAAARALRALRNGG
jgi:hypothetical protein